MGRYRKIDTRIWNDAKFRSLSDDGKFVFMFLLSHPNMTSLGAMRGSVPGFAADLGWSSERLREALSEGVRKGMAEHDEKACFVGLPNFLKYNGPESPNVVKSWGESLDMIPECKLKAVLVERVKGFAKGLSKAFSESLPKSFEGFANQEQEQEQEPEQEQETLLPAEPAAAYSEDFEAWWLCYPRRVAKPQAQKAWVNAVRRLVKSGATRPEAVDSLRECAKAFSQSPKGRGDPQYIPYPQKWLNEGRYEDDPADWQIEGNPNGRSKQRSLIGGAGQKFSDGDAEEGGPTEF